MLELQAQHQAEGAKVADAPLRIDRSLLSGALLVVGRGHVLLLTILETWDSTPCIACAIAYALCRGTWARVTIGQVRQCNGVIAVRPYDWVRASRGGADFDVHAFELQVCPLRARAAYLGPMRGPPRLLSHRVAADRRRRDRRGRRAWGRRREACLPGGVRRWCPGVHCQK
jgi:hypothetical protein